MREFSIRFFWVVFSFLALTSFFPALFGARSTPPVPLLLVLVFTLIFGFSKTLPWAVAIAFLADLLTYAPVGSSVIVYVVSAYSSNFVCRRFLAEGKSQMLLAAPLFVLGAVLFSRFFHFLVFWHQQGFSNVGEWQAIFSGLVTQLALGILTFYFLYWAVKKLIKKPEALKFAYEKPERE